MTKTEGKEKINVSKDEQVGFHKGALSTLAKEREELMRILSIVEQLMQLHIKSLKELGIDLAAQAASQKSQSTNNIKKSKDGKKKPIEDMI